MLSIIKEIFGDISPDCEHSGGTANCCEKAICEKCGMEYGDFNPNNHYCIGSSNVSIPIYGCESGYSGDLECIGCGAIIAEGYVIPATMPHDYWTLFYDTNTFMAYNECEICGDGYYQDYSEPLEIEYIKTEVDYFYFYANNLLPQNQIMISEKWTPGIDETCETSSPAFRIDSDYKSFRADMPMHGDIITITIVEFLGPGEIARQTSKQFNTQTRTWIEN
jgi:hypothetical protein